MLEKDLERCLEYYVWEGGHEPNSCGYAGKRRWKREMVESGALVGPELTG